MNDRLNKKEPEVSTNLLSHNKESNCASLKLMSMRSGKLCPYCGVGVVEYDSFLNLKCPNCRKTETGAYT